MASLRVGFILLAGHRPAQPSFFTSQDLVHCVCQVAYHPGGRSLALCPSPDPQKVLLSWHEQVILSSCFWILPSGSFSALGRSCPGLLLLDGMGGNRKQRQYGSQGSKKQSHLNADVNVGGGGEGSVAGLLSN